MKTGGTLGDFCPILGLLLNKVKKFKGLPSTVKLVRGEMFKSSKVTKSGTKSHIRDITLNKVKSAS